MPKKSSGNKASIRGGKIASSAILRMTDEEIKALSFDELNRLTDGLGEAIPDIAIQRLLDAEVERQGNEFLDRLAKEGLNLREDGFTIQQARDIEAALTKKEKSSSGGKLIDAALKIARGMEFKDQMLAQGYDLAGMGYNIRQISDIREGIQNADRESGGELVENITKYIEEQSKIKASPRSSARETEPKESGGIADWFSPQAWSDWLYGSDSGKDAKVDRRLVDAPVTPSPTSSTTAAPTPTSSSSSTPTPSVTASPSAFAEPGWWSKLLDDCKIHESDVIRIYNQTNDQTTFRFTNSTGNSTNLVLHGSMPFPATQSEARSSGLWDDIIAFVGDCILPSVSPTPSATASSTATSSATASSTATPSATTSSTATPTSTASASPFGVDAWVYSLWSSCGIAPASVTREYNPETDTTIFSHEYTYSNGTQAVTRLELIGDNPLPTTESEARSNPSLWSALRSFVGNCTVVSNSPSPTSTPSVTASTTSSPTQTTTASPTQTTTITASPTGSATPTPIVVTSSSPTPRVLPTPTPSPGWFPGFPDWLNEGLENCSLAVDKVFYGNDTPNNTADDRAQVSIGDTALNRTVVDVPIPVSSTRDAAKEEPWFQAIREADSDCIPPLVSVSAPNEGQPSKSSNSFTGTVEGDVATISGSSILFCAAAAAAVFCIRRRCIARTRTLEDIPPSSSPEKREGESRFAEANPMSRSTPHGGR